jgi:hypothetical protein
MSGTANSPLGPQPDYYRISQYHQGLADETLKIPNTPSFNRDRSILEALERLNAAVERLDGKLDTAVQRLDGKLDATIHRLDGLDTKINHLVEQQKIR